jgi:tetratricopeptide (TPR) repeat protein
MPARRTRLAGPPIAGACDARDDIETLVCVDTIPRRVFLSHTSELARLPAGRSFIDAAESAVKRSGDAVSNMAYFGPRAERPAEVCIREVTDSDIYVGIIGLRYGSPVRDRENVSYTELEFDTATAAGKPVLIIMLSEDAVYDESFYDSEYGDRQRTFRARLMTSDLTRVMITTPDQLATELLTGLIRLPALERGLVSKTIKEFPARNPVFTGRAEVIGQLHSAFRTGQRINAVYGMGGIGKTSAVIEYCERYGDDYDIIWWVPAEELALVPDRLAELSRAINAASDTETTVSAVSRLRTELARRRRWLIIFDNAEDPATLAPHLLQGPGHTVITSRNPFWEDLAAPVSMKVLDRPESIELVKKRLPQISHRDADRIAAAVDDLPLALGQAAAYLADTGMAPDTYVDLLASRATEVLAEGKPGNYPVSFASGLQIALEGIMADRPPAAELLTLAAFMAPEPVPLALFSAHSAILPTSLAAVTTDPLTFAGLTRLLRQRGVAQIGIGSIQMHRLVQAILRERADDSIRQLAVALLAAELLHTQDAGDPTRWHELLPHVLAAVSLDTLPGGGQLPHETEQLIYAAAKYLRTRGQAAAARPLLERVLRSWEITHGPNHPLVANALINLGWSLRDLGDAARAYAAYERALAIREAFYGEDHPRVATALTNCGLSLRELGEPSKARPLHERALAIRERYYGPDHRHVATVLAYLGQTLTDLGEPAAARPLLERALTIREKAYGPDHPRVGITAELLGLVMSNLGDRAAARALLERSHRLLAAAYGPDHPLSQKTAAEAASFQ